MIVNLSLKFKSKYNLKDKFEFFCQDKIYDQNNVPKLRITNYFTLFLSVMHIVSASSPENRTIN